METKRQNPLNCVIELCTSLSTSTFIFRNNPKRTAWIDGTAPQNRPYDILKRECPKPDLADLLDCVDRKLYSSKTNFGLKSRLGPALDAKNKTWDVKYRGGIFGVCHTFHYPHPTLTNPLEDGVQIEFDEKLSYNVYIHDPHFFLPTPNPSTFPSIRLTFNEGKDKVHQNFYIEVITYMYTYIFINIFYP